MQTKNHRTLSLSRYDKEISILLSWFENDGQGKIETKDMFIKFPNKSIAKQLETAVNKLVNKWAHVFLTTYGVQMVSSMLDDKAELFDSVVDSENAEQALLSIQ